MPVRLHRLRSSKHVGVLHPRLPISADRQKGTALNQAEEYAAGIAAFRAGEPFDHAQSYQWRMGFGDAITIAPVAGNDIGEVPRPFAAS